MGKDRKKKADDDADRPPLPPAKSIFTVKTSAAKGGADEAAAAAGRTVAASSARTGELLGMATPRFTMLTSRAMPLYLRPETIPAILEGPQFLQMPVGDLVLRQENVKSCPDSAKGCRGFWPHLDKQIAYCSFRNPRVNPSVHGGDTVCSVETTGGRRKVGPKEFLDLQRTMRMDLVAAPGEEVPLDVAGSRRIHRAVARAGEWLRDILEAKATDPDLDFDWHVLASIQGCGDLKVRQKACAAAAAMPVAGYWVGGLGYQEDLASRGQVLQAVSAALPDAQPRFLPLNSGSPLEVLQGVLLGIDVFEIGYPMLVAAAGSALTFSWEMPEEEPEPSPEALAGLLPPPVVAAAPAAASASGEGATAAPAAAAGEGAAPAASEETAEEKKADAEPAAEPEPAASESGSASAYAAAAAALPKSVKQLSLKAPEFKEDFSPICSRSPTKQYSRAYVHHLLGVRELLASILLAQHNLFVYSKFFEAIRKHVEAGTLEKFAAWFIRTQTCELPAEPEEPAAKKRKM